MISARGALAERGRRANLSVVLSALGLVLLSAFVVVASPDNSFVAIAAFGSVILVLMRPEWGVAIMLAALQITYGRPEVSGRSVIGSFLPRGGPGLLSINNMLGFLLAGLLAYRLYLEDDWSFLKNRVLFWVVMLSIGFVVSILIHPTDYDKLEMYDLPVPNQDPTRIVISRLAFVVLFVSFVRGPRELRLIIGVTLVLWLITALNGMTSGLSGQGIEERHGGIGYRAGGGQALVRNAFNPNRLAMISALSFVLVWEFGQSPRGRRWVGLVGVLSVMLALTVFLTASRSGVLGLAVAALLVVARRSNGHLLRRAAYGLMLAIAAGVVISAAVPEEAFERLGNIPGIARPETSPAGRGSIFRREQALRVALQISLAHPLTGVGLGNWETARFESDPARSSAVPHNSYLLALCEGGLIVLLLYLVVYWVAIRELGRLERRPEVRARAEADGVDWILVGIRECLIVFLVFSMFADLWESIIFYVLVGAAATLTNMYEGVRAEEPWAGEDEDLDELGWLARP